MDQLGRGNGAASTSALRRQARGPLPREGRQATSTPPCGPDELMQS